MSHVKGKCPAYKKVCRRCSKEGHFARMCQSKPINTIENSYNELSDTENFVIDAISQPDESSTTNEWLVKLLSNETAITYKLDTGTEVNVLPFRIFNQLKKRPTLQISTTKLTA